MESSPRDQAEQLFAQGVERLSSSDTAGAEQCFLDALALDDDFEEAWVNLGFVRDAQGDACGAETAYRQALAAGADVFELYLNLGVLFASQKRFDEAHWSYSQTLRLNSASAALWSNLGALYLAMRQDDDAQACLDQALAHDPQHRKAQFNRAYLHLRHGRFEEGWRDLEARDWYGPVASHFSCPRWTGETVAGKSLLLCYEAGHGDVIQFARYVPVLKAQGAARVDLLCHPALKRLMGSLNGIGEVIGFDENLVGRKWDYWTPLLSIPFHVQTRAHTIPAAIPYLRPSKDLQNRWATRLPANGFKVGLAWKGNPRFENDADRSLPHVRELAPVWQVPLTHFVSLQKGAGEHEANEVADTLPLLNLGVHMGDFADAAAIVTQLDLVICVDTAIAHLAGALGVPCWVMLPAHMTDWRWLAQGDTSAWYPGHLRLFRQLQPGDWSGVTAQLRDELLTLSRNHSR
jgi:tetratricopeptide (TPR) repeat protein